MLRHAAVSTLYALTQYREHLTGVAVCSAPNALAKNLAVTLSTDTPAKDQVVVTTFDFDLDAPIVAGTAYYDVTLNGFPYSASAPLCEETQKSGDTCPLFVGHHHEVSNATNTVTGKLVTKITWKDDADIEILCAQITTKTA
jgi:hypothetical protein